MEIDKNRFLIELSANSRTQFGRVDYQAQTAVQKVFSAIWGLEAEVNNGGFQQYFYNTTGEAAGDVVAALNTIGANKTAKIVGNAIALFPGGTPPIDWETRSKRLTEASQEVLARWEQLDREFFDYPNNLTNLLYDFVKAHPQEF
jgi:hypothetical protein